MKPDFITAKTYLTSPDYLNQPIPSPTELDQINGVLKNLYDELQDDPEAIFSFKHGDDQWLDELIEYDAAEAEFSFSPILIPYLNNEVKISPFISFGALWTGVLRQGHDSQKQREAAQYVEELLGRKPEPIIKTADGEKPISDLAQLTPARGNGKIIVYCSTELADHLKEHFKIIDMLSKLEEKKYQPSGKYITGHLHHNNRLKNAGEKALQALLDDPELAEAYDIKDVGKTVIKRRIPVSGAVSLFVIASTTLDNYVNQRLGRAPILTEDEKANYIAARHALAGTPKFEKLPWNSARMPLIEKGVKYLIEETPSLKVTPDLVLAKAFIIRRSRSHQIIYYHNDSSPFLASVFGSEKMGKKHQGFITDLELLTALKIERPGKYHAAAVQGILLEAVASEYASGSAAGSKVSDVVARLYTVAGKDDKFYVAANAIGRVFTRDLVDQKANALEQKEKARAAATLGLGA